MVRTVAPDSRFWVRQEDVVDNQVNPVSGVQYAIGVFTYARIYSISAETTGGTVQTLQVHVICDDRVFYYNQGNPVSGQQYEMTIQSGQNNQEMDPVGTFEPYRLGPLLEGKHITLTIEDTWTVQPSPIEWRVKWARYE